MIRSSAMARDYSKYIVKDYHYWSVRACINQGFLGRCVLWCKREDAFDLCDATPEELAELHIILKALRTAVTQCFNPDWFNYSFLGNTIRHLHCHFVPRYATTKMFMDTEFDDVLYKSGLNWREDPNFVTSEELLQGIKSRLIEALDAESQL